MFFCPLCGDRLGSEIVEFGFNLYCKECGDEKRDGIIGLPPISTPSIIRFSQDVTPVFELAERRFEGD